VNECYRHRDRDLEIFSFTLVISGETSTENGRLRILDNRELSEESAKHGDPDYLLNEYWVRGMPPTD
jgi:hypothetical protein